MQSWRQCLWWFHALCGQRFQQVGVVHRVVLYCLPGVSKYHYPSAAFFVVVKRRSMYRAISR